MTTVSQRRFNARQKRREEKAIAACETLKALFYGVAPVDVRPAENQPAKAPIGVKASRDPNQQMRNIDARVLEANNGRTDFGGIKTDTHGNDKGSTKNFPLSKMPDPKYAAGKPGLKAKIGSSRCSGCC